MKWVHVWLWEQRMQLSAGTFTDPSQTLTPDPEAMMTVSGVTRIKGPGR